MRGVEPDPLPWLVVCPLGVATLTTSDVHVRNYMLLKPWDPLDMKGISITLPKIYGFPREGTTEKNWRYVVKCITRLSCVQCMRPAENLDGPVENSRRPR